MEKIAVFLLCPSMLSADDEPNTAPGEANIGTVVPDSHRLTVNVTGNADVTVDGKEGTEFEVERLSQPVIEIKAKDGEKLTKVIVNGEDITDKLKDGKLTLDPIYEDMTLDIQVETETLSGDSSESEDPTESTPDSTQESSTESEPGNTSESTSPDAPTKPDGSDPSGGGAVNPVTGVIGTISAGDLIALGAMAMIKRKNKDKE